MVWLTQVEVLVHQVLSGSPPWWDPWTAFGQPLLANPNNQVLYPPAWLNLLLRPGTAYAWLAAGHLLLGAVGIRALLRRLGASREGALVGGAAWLLSGPVLSLVSVWHHLAGAAWMPWVILAADRALSAPTWRRSLAWGGVVAGQFLAGSPDVSLLTLLAQAALLAASVRWREPASGPNRRLVGSVLLAAGFALALAAGQWLPTLEAARASERWSLPEARRVFWSLHPVSALGTLAPVPATRLPLDVRSHPELTELTLPFLRSTYLGLPCLALVLGGALAGGRRRALFALLGLGTLLLALGRHLPVYDLATTLLPPLRTMRYPEKFLVLSALAWAVLAGDGYDAWRAGPGPGQRRLAGAALALVSALAAAAAATLHLRADEVATRLLEPGAGSGGLRPLAAGLALTALAGTLACFLTRLRPPAASRTAWLLAVLALLDLLRAHHGLNPTGPRDLLSSRPPTVDILRRDGASRVCVWDYAVGAAPGRVPDRLGVLSESRSLPGLFGIQAYLWPPLAGRWQLRGSFDPDLLGFYPSPLSSLVSAFHAAAGTPEQLRLLRAGGVDHVLALHREGLESLPLVAEVPGFFSEPIRVLRVPGSLPRAYAVRRALPGSEPARLLDGEIDPAGEVLLAEGAPEGRPGPRGPAGTVRLAVDRPDQIVLEADLDDPGWVVLLDSFDPGWEVTVDGRPAALLRANVAFRAVAVGAGRHRVEQRYRPRSLRGGLALTALAAAAGLVTTAAAARRGSRPARTGA